MIADDGCPRVGVLGVGVDALNMKAAVARVESWIANGTRSYGIFRDVHGVMLCRHDPELRRIHGAAGMVAPDGMPLVWLAGRLSKRPVSRVYGPDFLIEFCRTTQSKRYRHFFYGTTPQTLEKLIANLRRVAPDMVVAGTLAPPFRPLTDSEAAVEIEQIDAARPDVVWVGLSTPKQERWMFAHVGRLKAPALLGIGAAFDFHAGTKQQAPLWMQRSGLEWTFRLATEPRRLAGRYLRTIPAFAILIAAQLTGLHRYE